MKIVHALNKTQALFLKERRRLAIYPIAIIQRGPDNIPRPVALNTDVKK